MNQESHWPFLLLPFFESRRFDHPSHDLIAIVTFEPEFFTLKSIETVTEMLVRERGQAVEVSRFAIELFR